MLSFQPPKPFPHDKISDRVINTILTTDSSVVHGSGPNTVWVGRMGNVFIDRLMRSRLSLPDQVILYVTRADADSRCNWLWLLSRHKFFKYPVNKFFLSIFLDEVLDPDHIEVITQDYRKYSSRPSPKLNRFYKVSTLSIDPYPEEFIELCKQHFQVAIWFIQYVETTSFVPGEIPPNFVERVEDFKTKVDYQIKLQEFIQEKDYYMNVSHIRNFGYTV